MGPAEFEQLLRQGQCTIEDKTTRTGETKHSMPLLSVRPQFKPISLQTNLHPPFFAFCSPHSESLTQLDSGCNIQFLEIQFLRCPEGIEYSRHRAVHPRHQCRGFSRWIGKGNGNGDVHLLASAMAIFAMPECRVPWCLRSWFPRMFFRARLE